MWREQSECREHNMTQKLSDSHYVRNKERTSLTETDAKQTVRFNSRQIICIDKRL